MPQSIHTTLLASAVAADREWQMHYGERFALEGLLATLKPRLSIEIGRAEGGSLRRIAAHSGHVHSFDLVPETEAVRTDLRNITFHTGDSSVQVPEALAELAAAGQTVDFALVDGDHSAEGVKRDALALLASPACRSTTIVFHDAANDDVRQGLEEVRFDQRPNVALAMLDFVPGFLVEKGPYAMQIWNGLGLVVLDSDHDGPPVVEEWRYDAAAMQRRARSTLTDDSGEAIAPQAIASPAKLERLVTAAVAGGAAVAALAAGFAVGRRR